jgi:hypothetical protein
LDNVYFLELGNGEYESNNRYWYNFGRFNSKNEWVIDKPAIYKNLVLFAEENGLNVCPHFSQGKLKDSVDQLPSKIIIDNVAYRIHFTDFSFKGETIKFPENIRHISPRYRDQGVSSKMKYDSSKIKIIRRFESGEISEKPCGNCLE